MLDDNQPSLLYVGPSWAKRSFDTPDGSETDYTNLLKETGIIAKDLSNFGLGNRECIDIIKSYRKKISGIIWIYCEPLRDPTWAKDSIKELLEDEDFWQRREKISQETLELMNELNTPIALIGAHSDVYECNLPNITIIHPSWQRFLAETCGVDLKHGWGADVAHRLITTECIESKPSKAVIDLVTDTLHSWHKMEMFRLFNWCHPSSLGNQLFAKQIKSKLQSWMDHL